VAMLSSYGVAQVAILMLVELGYVLVIGVKWPYADSGDNKFHLLLGFIRLVVTGCSAAYVHDLNASPEARQIFGYIQMALHLITFIIMFALILWNTIQV
ncbi:TRP-like family, partial [Lobosporangium transversale]